MNHLAVILGITLLSLAFATAQQSQHPAKKAQQEETQPSAEQQLAETSNEAAGHGEAHDPHAKFKYSPMMQSLAHSTGVSVETLYWLSVLLNFAVLGLLVRLMMKRGLPNFFPPLRTFYKDRTSAIQQGLEEARRASEDANRRLSEIESRLSRLDSDIAEMQTNAELQTKEEEARLRAAVEEERQKILRSAEQGISSATGNAIRELKAYVAELSVSLAEKRIKVDAATDAEILRDFVEQLGSDGAGRRNS